MPLYDEKGRMITPGSASRVAAVPHPKPAVPAAPATPAKAAKPHQAAITLPFEPIVLPPHESKAPKEAKPSKSEPSFEIPKVTVIGSTGPVFEAPAVPVDDLLRAMLAVGEGVSDLFFMVGKPPLVENFGKLAPVPGTQFASGLQPRHTEGIARTMVSDNPRLLEDIRVTGSCDSSYAVEGLARFRVNIFKQKGSFALVLRRLNTKIPSMDDLKLPPVFRKMIQEKTGLIFVTGATGSGKTTTLAAMLNEINETMPMHMVTLEDPVEFLHPHKMAIMSQREMGKDFSTFALGVRAALRQAPKVILVGEIRDRETMEIALTAAETGHVVYSTLHTISAGQSINRVLGMFGKDEEKQVRERLSETLRWVVSQRLAPKIGGGRILIPEIMGSSLRSREAVLMGENENRTYADIMEQSRPDGWCTFEQSLTENYSQGLITEETAMLLSVSKSRMRQKLDVANKNLGVDKTTTEGIHLERDEKEDEAKKKANPFGDEAPITPPPPETTAGGSLKLRF